MSESANSYSLKLTGLGVAVDMVVDKTKAARILAIAMSETPTLAPSGDEPDHPQEQRRGGVLSLREHLNQHEARSKPQQIVAIASYMTEVERVPDVGRDDIKSRFALAREPLPANFPRDFITTVQNGWIAPVHGNPDRFYVTQSGVQALESHFSAPVRKATASRKRSAKSEI